MSRVALPREFYDESSFVGFNVEADPARPAFNFLAIIDPLSSTAQKLSPILEVSAAVHWRGRA